MKTVNLTCEWLLANFVGTYYNDENGMACIIAYSILDSKFVTLAFETMDIEYTEDEYFEDLDDIDSVFYEYKFKFEDIKEDCPKLYESMAKMFESNRLRNLEKSN